MVDATTSGEKTRAEIADYLRAFADDLDPNASGHAGEGEPIDTANRERDHVTLPVGDEPAAIVPPETLTFETSVDTEASMIESRNVRTIEFTLSWTDEHVEADDDLSLE